MSRRVAGYELIEVLGRGGMGVVWRARDAAGREVALKLLSRLDPRAIERLRREGVIAARLSHPGIVRALGAGGEDDVPWLASELVEGARPLDRAWEGLDLHQRVELLLQVVRAVAHAHAQGVVHRDLKPENVLVDASGRARVTDFGLARAVEMERLTRTGAMIGTPTHMAPEQLGVDGERPVNPPADVWSLGVMLYQALTGRSPLPTTSLGELMLALGNPRITPPRQVAPEVPAWLEAVCLRCLATRPEDRYPNAEELAEALSVSGGPARRRGRAWLLLAAGALSLIALGAAALLGPGSLAPHHPGGSAAGARAELTLLAPTERHTLEADLLVRGRVSAPEEQVLVKVGERPAVSVRGQGGEFEVLCGLRLGRNEVRVRVLDRQGVLLGEATREVVRLDVPAWLRALDPALRPPLPLPAGLVCGQLAGEYLNPKDGTRLVWVPPGRGWMGSRVASSVGALREDPPHQVTLGRGFFIARTEVTWGQFLRYCQETGRPAHRPLIPAQEDHPVHAVPAAQALGYCAWAGLRLPNEVEWERAARGEDQRLYPWGDEPDAARAAVDRHMTGARTEPVGSYPQGASPFGCLDMVGNVAELCWARRVPYGPEPVTDPPCGEREDELILRSCATGTPIDEALLTRRWRVQPTVAQGFRLACSAE